MQWSMKKSGYNQGQYTRHQSNYICFKCKKWFFFKNDCCNRNHGIPDSTIVFIMLMKNGDHSMLRCSVKNCVIMSTVCATETIVMKKYKIIHTKTQGLDVLRIMNIFAKNIGIWGMTTLKQSSLCHSQSDPQALVNNWSKTTIKKTIWR